MITPIDEYKKIILQRLDENRKSFDLLYGIKHYGNCISIMCQELDQVMKLLFLLNSPKSEQIQYIKASINNQKWFITNKEFKKEYLTEDVFTRYSETLDGWDRSIYEFGLSFGNMATTFNYGTRDPIKSIGENDKEKIRNYIVEYHNKNFPKDYDLGILIIELPTIFNRISVNLQSYINRLLNTHL
jgi:hypothetical protein